MIMGSSKNTMTRVALLLSWFSYISSTLDLNIISYDNNIVVEEELRSEVEMRWLYEEWLVRFDKSHVDVEKERRFEVFKDNLRFVDEHNRLGNNYSYTVGLNEFADLTNEEYRQRYVNKLIGMRANTSILDVGDHEHIALQEQDIEELGQLPVFVDWRSTGAVGPVINQGSCGSCWAWTAAAAVEGLHQILTGDLIRLSAQQILDCTGNSSTCAGGYVHDALDYVVKNGGIDTLDSYPYKNARGACKQNAAKVVSIDSRKDVLPRDEKALQRAVAKQPVGVTIEAAGRHIQLYSGGIFNGPCGKSIDHAVILIGYGTENGKDYWLIKNTWGVHWGQDGFVRLERNIASNSGRCGITEYRSHYPERRQGP